MANGIASGAWGYSPKQVAEFDKLLNNTYQLSLTSVGGSEKFTKFGETECESFNRLKKTCTEDKPPVDQIFVGKKPKPPQSEYSYQSSSTKIQPQSEYSYRNPSTKSEYSYQRSRSKKDYSNKEFNYSNQGVNSDGNKFIKIDKRIFAKGDNAKINENESAQIIKIGPKQIIFLLKNNKERRLKINQFIEFNK
jgi:hypothetical protein